MDEEKKIALEVANAIVASLWTDCLITDKEKKCSEDKNKDDISSTNY